MRTKTNNGVSSAVLGAADIRKLDRAIEVLRNIRVIEGLGSDAREASVLADALEVFLGGRLKQDDDVK